MTKYKAKQLSVIGWREMLTLPDLNIEHIKAKIDTGARTSALHAFDCQEFKQDDQTMIRFAIHPLQRDNQKTIVAEAELLEYRKVTSSGGHAQIRPVIMTTVKLGEHQWQVELTLTNRDVMGFRMLLGRQAVRDRFSIDPGKSFLQSCRH
ncbi:MAG: ATP-dependent zinc protease [Cyanobacteria bacterium P01_G01_bin.67]